MSKSKKQKLYKMRGCSKKSRKHLGSKRMGGSKNRMGGSNIVNSSNMRTNPNASNPVYPNTGAPPAPQNWINSSILKGGTNNGLPYGQGLATMKPILSPSGLTGNNWSANFGWPGTNSVGVGGHNHYSLNKYAPVDISRQTQLIGAQRPFLGGGRKNKSRKQRGGTLSNFLHQDFINIGRQFGFGLNSAYNTLGGHNSPVNPMPWNQPRL